jgi:methylmalonyl-CoA mutase C-terminal domain/subunit
VAKVGKVISLMRQARADDVRLVVGGVVPDEDVATLRDMGVADVILQGTPPEEIVARIRGLVGPRAAG